MDRTMVLVSQKHPEQRLKTARFGSSQFVFSELAKLDLHKNTGKKLPAKVPLETALTFLLQRVVDM